MSNQSFKQMHATFNLEGKIALITGGAGLLGSQHAAALADSGAKVIITDIDMVACKRVASEICDNYGSDVAIPMVMDVSDTESVQRVHDSLIKQYDKVDILINNAAIDPKVGDKVGMVESSRLENFPMEQWDLQIGVGLTGAFICSKVFGYTMSKTGGGVILNIASDLGVIAPDQRLYRKDRVPEEQQSVKPVTYSVIKTGLIGLTRYLSTYWADKSIRVNALSPGGVYTNQPSDFVAKLSSLIPLGRMAKQDEYRASIQFLCSDASSYMTGQNIVMDGGRSVW